MIGAFSFNNVDSSTYSLVCKSIKRPLLPAARVKRTELLNASGVYDFADPEYGIRDLTMRITYIGTSFYELRTRARDIAAWLSTSNWAQLIINDENDKYYLAKVTEAIDMSTMLEAGEAEIAFDCQPFAYSVTEEDEDFTSITSQTDCVFTNPGTRVINYKSPQGSKSLITVVGSWTTLTFALNGKTLSFSSSGSGSTLIIDNVDMEATVGGGNEFEHLGGDIETFLPIESGENTLAVGGTGLNIDVNVNYIPLWI